MILWDGGIYFGGMMASLFLAIDLYRHTENYMPSRSPAAVVLFSWIWILIVYPIFCFGTGCLFGFVGWKMQKAIGRKYGNRVEKSDD